MPPLEDFPCYTSDEIATLSENQQWVGLKIVYHRDRGYGVVAAADIPKGRVVCNYSGLVLPADAAEDYLQDLLPLLERNARAYAVEFQEGKDRFYILAHGTENPPSFGRLLNHSKKHPNCRVYRKNFTLADGQQDTRQATKSEVSIVIVETLRKISFGEELVWNYGRKYARAEWFNDCHCKRCSTAGYYSAKLCLNTTAKNGRLPMRFANISCLKSSTVARRKQKGDFSSLMPW